MVVLRDCTTLDVIHGGLTENIIVSTYGCAQRLHNLHFGLKTYISTCGYAQRLHNS